MSPILHMRARAASPPSRHPTCWRVALVCIAAALAAGSRAGATALEDGAETYRRQLIADIGQALTGARTLRARIAADDLDGARQAWVDARVGWERSEVFTGGFVPELDRQIDAWPNATHGFHGIEAGLFGTRRQEVGAETDALIDHLTQLQAQVRDVHLAPQRLLNGIARLAFEIGDRRPTAANPA